MTCLHHHKIKLQAKSVDSNWIQWPDGMVSEGYAPDIPGLCGGDYIEADICLDCSTVLGMDPETSIAAWGEADSFDPGKPRNIVNYAEVEDDLGLTPGLCDVCGYPEEERMCEFCGGVDEPVTPSS